MVSHYLYLFLNADSANYHEFPERKDCIISHAWPIKNCLITSLASPALPTHLIFYPDQHFVNYFFCKFIGGLECVGHSFAYIDHLVFLRDVWIRTQRAAVEQARHPSPYLVSHPPPYLLSHPSPYLVSHPPPYLLSHPSPYLLSHLSPYLAMHPSPYTYLATNLPI
jgi:hypothetical protein